jgi:hypothetical protein
LIDSASDWLPPAPGYVGLLCVSVPMSRPRR